jgi:hypothetical protein
MKRTSPIHWSTQVRSWTGTVWVVVNFVAKLLRLWREFHSTR